MYRAMDLSKYIVSKCINDDHPISNLQLQKILYYIQKDFLSRDDIAFSDDIEAWQFGPVVPLPQLLRGILAGLKIEMIELMRSKTQQWKKYNTRMKVWKQQIPKRPHLLIREDVVFSPP